MWPTTSLLISLHTIVWLATAFLFYTSHAPDRQWTWVYELMAGYPSSLLVRFLAGHSIASLAATLLFLGTAEWGIIGVVIDTIIHRVRCKASRNI
jgi:hypothetical protein